MKTNLLMLLAILAVGFCAVSCEKDLEIDKVSIPDKEIINSHYAIIESMGFSTEGIKEEENCYVVEGDIVVMKADLDSMGQGTRQMQWKHRIKKGRENGIRVSTVALYNDKWKRALLEAMDAWNGVPHCNVRFSHVGNWAGEMSVHVNNLIDAVADGALPSSGGYPGIQIRINTSYDGENEICHSHESKVSVMIHELGHILGLGHTDMPDKGMSPIPGTPRIYDGETDVFSVMNQQSYRRPWGEYGFTRGDLAAIQSLYGEPIWSGEIIGPEVFIAGDAPVYGLELGTNLIDLDVSWYVDDYLAGRGTSFTPSGVYPAYADRNKTVTIKAVVSYGNKEYAIEKEVTAFHHVIIKPKESSLIGEETTYSVDTPEGMTFVGWSLRIPYTQTLAQKDSYEVRGGMNNTTFNFKFLLDRQYELVASFRLPDGTPNDNTDNQIGEYGVLVSPVVVKTPIIYGFKAEGGRWIAVTSGGAMTLSGFVVVGGGTGGTIPGNMRPAPQPVDRIPDFGKPLEPWAMIQVSNATSNEVDYEWSINGAIQTGEDEWSWPYLEFIQKTFYDRAIRCRAVYHGATSDWSNVIILTSSTIIDGTLAAPVISADKTSAASGEMVTFTVADPTIPDGELGWYYITVKPNFAVLRS